MPSRKYFLFGLFLFAFIFSFLPCTFQHKSYSFNTKKKSAHPKKKRNNKNVRILKLNLSYDDIGKLDSYPETVKSKTPFHNFWKFPGAHVFDPFTSRSHIFILCSCVISCEAPFFAYMHKNIPMVIIP